MFVYEKPSFRNSVCVPSVSSQPSWIKYYSFILAWSSIFAPCWCWRSGKDRWTTLWPSDACSLWSICATLEKVGYDILYSGRVMFVHLFLEILIGRSSIHMANHSSVRFIDYMAMWIFLAQGTEYCSWAFCSLATFLPAYFSQMSESTDAYTWGVQQIFLIFFHEIIVTSWK